MRDVGSAPASSSDILRFDFRLLRVPTFDGGLAAAFAISASLFSLLTYLVLYMQTLLGLSCLPCGPRLTPPSPSRPPPLRSSSPPASPDGSPRACRRGC